MFKVLIAPDTFKGSLNASQISDIFKDKFSANSLPVHLITLPLADGGEGSLEAIELCGDFVKYETNVIGPQGFEIEAYYLFDKQSNTAFIELAQASGLGLVKGDNDILTASTYGTGQLMKNAIEKDISKIVLFLGGSATCDAGLGVADALGIKFFNLKNEPFSPSAKSMNEISDFDASGSVLAAKNIEILLAVDVNNPFFGTSGASYVYSPQKGANAQQVRQLDKGLEHLAQLIELKMGLDLQQVAGSGAAGGTAGGLLAFLGAKIIPATDFIFNLIGLEEKIKQADLIISGEGKIDYQSINNKLMYGISKLTTKHHKKLWAICGLFDGKEELLNALSIEKVFSLANNKDEIADSMTNSWKKLEEKCEVIIKEIKTFI